MFSYFEKLFYPYPDTTDSIQPMGFLAFVWDATHGVRIYLVAMTLLTAAIGSFEGFLCDIVGKFNV